MLGAAGGLGFMQEPVLHGAFAQVVLSAAPAERQGEVQGASQAQQAIARTA